MNFLVALILIGINMEEEKLAEEYAFTILVRLLQTPENGNFRLESLYEDSLKGLFTLSDNIYAWLTFEYPSLDKHLKDN